MADNKDLLRIGKISSFDYPNGTARITYEDKSQSTTTEMPFISWQYRMPKVGDQVLVAHLSNGTSAAVILGPVWHDGHRPPEGYEGLYRREYCNSDGQAYERYDEKAKEYTETITGTVEITATEEYTIKVGGNVICIKADGTIDITAASKITLTAPNVQINGDLKVTEDVKAGGAEISLINHTHTDSVKGTTTKPN